MANHNGPPLPPPDEQRQRKFIADRKAREKADAIANASDAEVIVAQTEKATEDLSQELFRAVEKSEADKQAEITRWNAVKPDETIQPEPTVAKPAPAVEEPKAEPSFLTQAEVDALLASVTGSQSDANAAAPKYDWAETHAAKAEPIAKSAPSAEDIDIKDDHWYNMKTKLDLASAYREIGDFDGAREVLAEVFHEGNS